MSMGKKKPKNRMFNSSNINTIDSCQNTFHMRKCESICNYNIKVIYAYFIIVFILYLLVI